MIGTLSRLFRWRLALVNGVSAVAGCLLFPSAPEAAGVAALFLGVTLMAAGASAFNQFLERDLDRLMLRTAFRPLPAGKLTPAAVALIAAASFGAGFLVLLAASGLTAALLGGVVLLWYLWVYTPLKRRSSLALALGALCGAVPPLMGWSAAGGSISDLPILLLAGCLYLWQVPHFWLLQRRHADDYRRAGFALFDPALRGRSPAPIFLLWMFAMVAAFLMLPAFGMIGRGAALWCAASSVVLLIGSCRRCEPALFAYLNMFPLLITSAVIWGR